MSTPTKEKILASLACLEGFDREAIEAELVGRDDRVEILAGIKASYVSRNWFDDYRAFCESYGQEMGRYDLEKILAGIVQSGAFDAFPVAEALSRKLTQLELLELSIAIFGESREDALDQLRLHEVPRAEIPSRVLERLLSLATSQYQLMREETPGCFISVGDAGGDPIEFRTLRWLHEAAIVRLCYSAE